MQAKVVITPADLDRTVELRVGGEAVVRLPWSPGTGYGWSPVREDPSLLALQGPPGSEGDGEPRAGGPETQVFRFRARKTGTVTLEFHHRRPWEKDAPPTGVFRVRVAILA